MGLWQPTEDTKEIAVIFEDDLTVSPFFYRYLKNVHAKYVSVPYINSYALQCSMKHNGKEGNLHAPDSNPVFYILFLVHVDFHLRKGIGLNSENAIYRLLRIHIFIHSFQE